MASPLDRALTQLGVSPDNYRQQPTDPKAAFDQIAQRTGVPANVLIALDEAQGGKWSVDGAQANAQGLAQAMQGGATIEDAIRGALGDDAASQRLLTRSYDIADALYSDGKPEAAPDKGSDGRVSIGEAAGGLARAGLAGAVRGVGSAAEMGAILTDEMVRGKDGPETPLRDLGRVAGDWIKGKGDAIAEGASEDYKERVAGTQPGGDLFKPSTWTLGEQWSFLGLANIAAEGVGSMVPMVAAPNAPAAAVIGALMAGGEGAENAREFLKEASEAINPETGRPEIEALPEWRKLVDEGKTPDEATKEITRRAENSAGYRQGIIGGFGGAATNRIMRGAEGWLGSGGRVARAAKKAGAGALEEGVQEATEQVASTSGIASATGADLDLTEDTFGDFIGGALAGGGMGAAAGASGFGARGNQAHDRGDDEADDIGAPPGETAPAPPGLTGEILGPEEPMGAPGLGGPGPDSGPTPGEQDWSVSITPFPTALPSPDHVAPDGSRGDVAAAGLGVSPLTLAAAQDAGAMGATPSLPGPIEAAMLPTIDAVRSLPAPQAEPEPVFPDYRPGARIELLNPATGQLVNAAFLRETPEGNAHVRVAGETIELTPAELDAARDAVEPFKAVQKEAEKAIRMGQGEGGGQVQANRPTPSPETGAGVIENLPTPSGETEVVVPRRPIRSDRALTARGREIPVEYAVVDLDSITPSQTDDGRDNPAYPQALQPRDRSGNRSQMQVAEIARDLRPELLGENPSAASGAPIVTPEGHVISGNGRTLALRKAYQGEGGQRYRAFLEGQGYPVEGIERPALVRVMDTAGMTDEDLAATAREANERDTASMSTSEQGMADAANIDTGALSLYRGGDIDSVANRDFVRAALPSIASPAEMGGLVRDDGSLTQDAIRRLNAALLARAYGDADLIASVLEATDGNIKAIGGALMDVSGRVAQMRDAAEANTIASQMDQTAALMEAVRLVSRARREGRKVDEFVNQTDIFSGDTISPMGRAFLNIMFRDAPKSYARPKSRDKLVAQLITYVDEAEKTAPGRDMLGHEADPAATLEQIGGRDAERDTGQGGLFAPRHGGDGESSGSGRGDGSQHEIQPSEAGSGAVDPRPAETGQRDAGGGITIEPIRARAAVVRGIPKDQPPTVGKVRFSWDDKAGGFVFSRKHADAVRDALTGEQGRTPTGEPKADVDVHETASGAQQTPLSGASERQTDAKPKRPQPGDPDYTREDAVADLHALEERRDGGIVGDARLEDRIRQQAELVRTMTATEMDAAAAEAEPEETITDPAPDRDMIEGQEEGETTDEPDAGSDDRGLDQGGVDDAGRPSTDERGPGNVRVDGEAGREADQGDPGPDGAALAGGVERDGPRDPLDPASERQGESPGNFVIAPDFPLGEGTAGQKIKANLAAIKLVLKLEAENRFATPAEQAVLARYVGWGGLKSVFDPKKRGASDQYGRAQAELRELLTDREYRAAARSTADAHYTSRTVVNAMWDTMRRFGFDGGRAMEPTVGTGNFIGLMPGELSGKTDWYAAELDRVTGLIAKHLYPDAVVFDGTGFQDAQFRNNSVDIAIGNPPFGADTIKSDLYPEIPPLSVHNFIIAKTGMHLREGGIMGMVVTSRFLDTANPQARTYLARHFNFLGAVRLPNTAFLENAGTEVTTDVVWFQRKAESEPSGNLQWLETGVEGPNGTTINGYFAANPDMMLGRPAMDGKMYGGGAEFTLHPDGRTLEAAMAEGLAKIDARLPERTEALQDAVIAQTRTSDLAIGQSALLEDGRIVLRRDDDAEGNAVIEDVDQNTPWGDAALPLAEAVTAAEAMGRSMTPEAIEGFASAAELVGSVREDGGGLRKSPPAGVGKAAHEAISAIYNAVTADTPSFGKAERDALKALKDATDAKRIGPKKLEVLRAMLSLRNATQALLAAERRDDPKIERMRKELAKEYDAFVKKHGFISRSTNEAIIGGVPGIEAALEADYKKGSPSKGIPETAKPAAILRKRIITPYQAAYSAESSADGMHISIRERGHVDLDMIARLTGKDTAEVRADLTEGDKPLAFQDPELSRIVPADEYLSGNLAEKIEQAERAGLHKNAKALKAAMPAPKTADQITPSIRGLWIPGEIFADFLRELGASSPTVRTDMRAGTMFIGRTEGRVSDFGEQFRTERKSPFEIFEAVARGKTITIYDTVGRNERVKNGVETKNAAAAAERMSAEFQKWAYMNPERQAKIVDAFNEKMNVIVERKFDGVSYLTTVGANPEIELRNSQKNGAWRMIQTPSTLLHHVVGAGKTFTAITAIMERKRMGLSRKTLVAVPNHLVTQWARDFYALYPGANILAASEKDFSLKNRRKLIARIATGDYDAIIIGHSQLRAIDNDPEQVKKVMKEQIADLEESLEAARVSGDSDRTVSQIQRRIEKYETALDETLKKLRGEGIGFNLTDTGIDNIVVDEAQEFKNLEYSTATKRLVGMNSPEGSQRALDLYIKTRSMFDAKGSVGFLTGTPVSNSLVEIYTVMKYLAPQTLRQMNLMHFDAWASAFIEAEDRFEYTPSMKLKERRVMSGLVNLGPLSTLYKTFADIVMRPQVEEMYREQIEAENAAEPDPSKHKSTRFPTPKVKGGGRRLITVPASEAHDEFTDYLVMRTDGIRRNARDKDYAKIDNMLWVLSDARKASIDIRTIDPTMPRSPDSKVVRAGDEILRLAREWDEQKGTQMVFADSSVPVKNASKDVRAFIVDAWKKAGLAQREATARVNAAKDAGRTWMEAAGAAMDAVEERLNDGALSDAQRETVEEWMNDDAREGMATAATADSGFSFYDDLKAYLVENGMKAEEIAFIHDYPTADRKAALFEDVNAGRVRVLIGSTFKMGAGTNAQERLVGLHHIDAPWRPSDMEQREGRIIRQGNALYEADPEGFEVEITAYATEKTADVVLWQVLERKAAGIEQFLNSAADKLTEEDGGSDADVYANFMAQSTGNPVFLRKMEAEKERDRIRADNSTVQMIVSEAKSFLAAAPARVKGANATLKAIEGVSFSEHGETAGKTWTDYSKAYDAYQDRRAAHEKAEADVRERNEKLPEGAKREPLPKFEEKAPEIFPGGKAADPWFDRVVKILKSVKERRIEDGRVTGLPSIKIGDVTLQIEARSAAAMGEGRYEYTATLRTGNDEWSLLGWGRSVTVKDPLNSRTLIAALSPDGIRARLDRIAEVRRQDIADIETATPEMERKALIKPDTAALREAERKARMYSGLVRVAEVSAAQGRIGKANRFADMDDKDRDLALDNSDDAPVTPADGKPSFEIKSAGKTYLANFGAKGASFNRDGASVDQVWIKGRSEDGDVKLFLAERETEKSEAKGEAPKVTMETVDTWDVSEEDGRDRREGGEAISAAMARRINAAAHDALARAGLLGKVGLKVGGAARSGITGRYARGVISILRDGAKGWRHTLDHEIIHALRDSERWGARHGLFSQREWRALVAAARANKGIRDRVNKAYSDQPARIRSEEMVAELYADWARSRRNMPEGPLLNALRKIQSFFRAVASALRGEGFVDAQRIMLDIAEGRVGARGEVAEAVERSGERERRDMNEPTFAERTGLTDGVLRARGFIGNLHWRKGPDLFSDMLTDAMGKHDSMNVLSLVPGRALFSELGRHIKAAQQYLHEKESMDAERNAWHSRGDAMSKKWWKLRTKDSESNQALMDLMHASTLSGIDPSQPNDWVHPRAAYAEKHADSGTQKQRDEAQRIRSEIRDHKSTYERLKADFDALPAEFQSLYRDVRDQYSELADAMDEALVENIKTATEISLKRAKRAYRKEMERIRDEGLEGDERDNAEAAAQDRLNTAEKRAQVSAKARQAAMRAAFESNRMKGPYFPLARFGKYFVTIRDEDGAVVSFSRFEKKAQQEAFIRDAEDRGLGAIERGVLNGDANLRDMVDPRYVSEVEDILSDAGAGADLMDAIWQHWLETLPDQSVRKNRIHRKGRAGFSTDAFRAFGKQMFHGSHQLARLKHGLKMEEMLNEAEEQAAEQPNPERAGFVVQEMRRRHNFAMNPTGNPVASTLTGLGFVWYLGMSPAAAVVNMSQTTLIGTPIMAHRWKKAGVSGSVAAVGRAMRDFADGRGWSEKSARLTAPERAALAEAYRLGTIDKTQAHDLAAVAESGVEYSPVRQMVMEKIGFMFHHAERLNREVTFLANYRLARAEGMEHEAAIREASDLTWKIHFDYQNTSRPRFMQGDVAKVLTLFRSYSVNVLWRLFRDAHQTFKGASEAERAEARAQLIGITLSMMAHAGIRGTWGFGILMMLLGMFFPGGGDDAEKFLENALLMEGDDMGTAAWNWIMGLALNGVPGGVTGVDVTQRIGMPNLWFRSSGRDLEGSDAWNEIVNDMLGPVFGIGANAFRAAGMAKRDGWRAIETASPKFVRDGLQSYRFATEGAVTMNGDPLLESVSPRDVLVKVTGFTPAKLSERYRVNNRLKNEEKRIMDERKALHREIGDAIKAEGKITEKVMRKLERFNSRFPEYPITHETIRQSIQGRARASDRNEFGVSLNQKLNARLRGQQAPMIYN